MKKQPESVMNYQRSVTKEKETEREPSLFPAPISLKEKEKERERAEAFSEEKKANASQNEEFSTAQNEEVSASLNTVSSAPTADAAAEEEAHEDFIDFKAFKDYYNKLMPANGITHIRVLDERRRKLLRSICRRPGGKEELLEVLQRAAKSRFLNGGGNRGWRADLDWLLTRHNFVKVLEGRYDNPPTASDELRKREAEARRAANRLIEEEARREERQRRDLMGVGAVSYEEYMKMKQEQESFMPKA